MKTQKLNTFPFGLIQPIRIIIYGTTTEPGFCIARFIRDASQNADEFRLQPKTSPKHARCAIAIFQHRTLLGRRWKMDKHFHCENNRVDLLIGSQPLAPSFDKATKAKVLAFFNKKEFITSEYRIIPGKYDKITEEVLVLRVLFRSSTALIEQIKKACTVFSQDSIGMASQENSIFLRISSSTFLGQSKDTEVESIQILPQNIWVSWKTNPALIKKGGAMVQPYKCTVTWVESFHINLHLIRKAYDAWLEKEKIQRRYFVDLDGGGINFYTIEFLKESDALRFINYFKFKNGKPWIYSRRKTMNKGWYPYKLER